MEAKQLCQWGGGVATSWKAVNRNDKTELVIVVNWTPSSSSLETTLLSLSSLPSPLLSVLWGQWCVTGIQCTPCRHWTMQGCPMPLSSWQSCSHRHNYSIRFMFLGSPLVRSWKKERREKGRTISHNGVSFDGTTLWRCVKLLSSSTYVLRFLRPVRLTCESLYADIE